jgi:outer membrane protein W
MKKTILKMIAVAGIVTGSVLTSNAQIAIGLTGGFGSPMGDMSNKDKGSLGSGFGGGLTGRYFVNDNMAVGVNLSYFSFTVNDVPSGVTASYNNMPITAAFDYYFMDEGFKPYAGLEAGFINTSYKTSTGGADISFSKGGLLVAPVVGFAYEINDNIDLMLNAKYMYGMTSGKQDVTVSGVTGSVETYDATFLNINLGVSYKLGN